MKVFYLILFVLLFLESATGVLPLRDQWAAANRALLKNQPEKAYFLFQEFHDWYADEKATKDPEFRERWHRLWGLSALQAGSFEEGIKLLETWIAEHPDQLRFKSFVRFQLASAHLATGNPDSAVNHWRRFLDENPMLPECALVHWLWADLLITQSDYAEAQVHLEQVVCDEKLPETGRSLAECALSLVLLADGQHKASFDRLAATSNNRITRIWKAILAPDLTRRFLESEEQALAMQSCQWFASMDNFLDASGWDSFQSSQNQGSVRELIWNKHWQNQLNKASNSAHTTLDSDFGLSDLYLLRLRTYLNSDASLEAFFLCRFLLASKQPELVLIREKVYAHVTEACLNLEEWSKADTYVQAFLEDYPDNPEIPNILFLQARTSAARSDWDMTIRQIDRLIETYPQHKSNLAWKIAAAGWYAQAGYLEEALDSYIQLEKAGPSHWLAYLQFERAQCLNKLQRIEEATELYQQLSEEEQSSSIAEQASLALLKIHLSRMNSSGFLSTIENFRRRFSYSQHLVTADLLMGSFYEFSNQVEEAVRLYTQVGETEQPEAVHAHRQLSRIYASQQDYSALRQHALAWINKTMTGAGEIPEHAFEDCLLYQKETGTPSLPDPLAATLFEKLLADDSMFPGHRYLELLHHQWDHYSLAFGITGKGFSNWLDTTSINLRKSKKLISYSVLMLYQAKILEQSDRSDSADTKRIQILTTVDPSLLNRRGLFNIGKVAHKYDFPEASLLLKSFLGKHRGSSEVPYCLRMLAQRSINDGDPREAELQLEIIHNEWQDSPEFIPATLQLAQLQYEGNSLSKASHTIDSLLERTNLPPRTTAESLLLRGLVDLDSGNQERCILNCRRIITLYPNFSDISNKATDLLKSFQNV